MNNIITEIKNYILFLKKDCDLAITLHPYGNEHLISNSELILFNIHENPHCIYVKTFPKAFAHCIERQKKVMAKCEDGSFCGTCYAGVQEYVYPIYDATTMVGFISVSGYKNSDCHSYIEKCSAKFRIPYEELQKTVLSLKNEMPDKFYVDTLIFPLTRMLELAYTKLSDIEQPGNIIDEIIKYVNRHYQENITLEQICKVFTRSRSCISHTFKSETGQTFREYLIAVRLRSAKSLLLYSNLSVTEIAFSVGFNDSNYFSNVFKKHIGLSPVKYRNAHL